MSFSNFFSGSASSANAVIDINAKDTIRRKFIAIQIPAILDLNNAPQKEAYEFLKENNYLLP